MDERSVDIVAGLVQEFLWSFANVRSLRSYKCGGDDLFTIGQGNAGSFSSPEAREGSSNEHAFR